jgi:hypothetical protein
VEVCEGRFPKQFPFLLDWLRKEEAQPCLASCKEPDELQEMELGCCLQVPCRGDGQVEAPLEEGSEGSPLPLDVVDHGDIFAVAAL